MHAIVSGAGVAGLALAGRLALDGWSVDLVERAPAPRRAGYLIDLYGAGFDAVERLGLLPALRERAESYAEVRTVDATGRVRARLPASHIDRAADGRSVTIVRPQLVAALASALPAGVRMRWGVQAETIHEEAARVSVLLSDGERIEGDLLVGADGIGSRVRQLAWGPHSQFVRRVADALAVAWVGDDPTLAADLGGRIAMQSELDRHLVLAPLGPSGVTGFAVLRGVEPSGARAAIADMGVLGRRAVRSVRQPYLEHVAQTLVGSWVKGRIALLGDAAGAVSLLAGQGASLGLAGAERLAEELAYAKHPSDVTAGLAVYEREWRPVVEREQARGRRSATAFAPHTRIELEAQRAMWKAASLPGVGALVARGAGGLAKPA